MSAQHLAERLGYGSDARLLIVHADDAGMSHSANAATVRAMTEGCVSSAGVMAPCSWFFEFAAWAKEHPDADVGIHLTLTSEWKGYRWGPVASKDRVPGLVDGQGCLWPKVEDVARRASAAEVETELRAQIERVLEAGVRPTHLDSHMGTLFARRDYFDVYLKLGMEYGIPPMVPVPTPEQVKMVDPAIIGRIEALRAEGAPVLDRLVLSPVGETAEEREASFFEIVRGLKPGVTQLIVHLIGDDPEARHIAGTWTRRYLELNICTSPKTRALLEEEGVRLVGYRPLGRLWEAAKGAAASILSLG